MNRGCESPGEHSRSSALGGFLEQEGEQTLRARACSERDATSGLLTSRCHLPADTEVFVHCCQGQGSS